MDTKFVASPNHSSRGSYKPRFIFLHYTSDGGGAVSYFQQKLTASAHYVVMPDGEIVQMVELDRAAWHIGNFPLNQQSVGIEVVNWGELSVRNGQCYTWTGKLIPYENTVPYEGRRWEEYTREAVNATVKLVYYLSQRLNIPLQYPFDPHIYPYFMDYGTAVPRELFKDATGVAGHCQVQKGKADPGPHWLSLVPGIGG
jgi:N-acetyl-anhydromuramyl-L-alanine amidase AmpD